MRGLGLEIYGTEGMGKTSFGIEWKRLGPLTFCSIRESGFEDLMEFRDPDPSIDHYKVTNWSQLLKIVKGAEEKSTLVIDSLSGVQQILFDYVCQTIYKGVWEGKDGFTSFWRGQRVDSPKELENLLIELDNARNRKVNVVLLGHAKLDESVNTIGANTLVRTIDLDKEVLASFKKWAQAIIFMHLDILAETTVESDKDTKAAITVKAKDRDVRLMYVNQSPGHSAKNRDLFKPGTAVIKMGDSPQQAFTNFYNSLPEVYKKAWPLKS